MGRPSHTRSDFGCWTCRARKKKCDEAFPSCVACTSRGMICHGYGPKPDWMDGGVQEKKVLEGLKLSLKEFHRNKKAQTLTLLPNQHGQDEPPRVIRSEGVFLPQNSTNDVWPSSVPQPKCVYPDRNGSSDSPEYTVSLPEKASTPSSTPPFPQRFRKPETSTTSGPLPVLSMSSTQGEREAALLMNYIDRVFSLQFVCYNPPLHEFGRGWLLAFLTNTQPLYHMAIALSAYHLYLDILNTSRTVCRSKSTTLFEKHYALALTKLQDQVAELKHCSGREKVKGSCEVLACILQMINYELLKGSTDHWQIHLSAASTLFPTILSDYYAQPLRHPTIPAQMAFDELDIDVKVPSSIDELSRDFQIGTFTWIDIIRSASIQTPPLLDQSCIRLLEDKDTSRIRLDKIIGCENWALILISKISELHRWKLEALRTHCLSMTELLNRAASLQNQLERGLATISYTLAQNGENEDREEGTAKPSSRDTTTRKTIAVITRIFASAALTYLHIVTYGARNELQEIRDSVALCINALGDLSDPMLLRSVVWPFCVAACMARGRVQREFFEGLVKEAALDEGRIGMLWAVLRVVRECWKGGENEREMETGDLPWFVAMRRLGFEILLV